MAHRLARLGALLALLCSVALAAPIDPPADRTPEREPPATAPPADVPSSTGPPADVASATEGSKMSRFLDDVTSAFKQGTAKMKESLESAASSVKDGVLQGYDYVRSKLTGAPTEGQGGAAATADDDAGPAPTLAPAALTSPEPAPAPAPAPSTERPAAAFGGAPVGVSHEPARIVPNDDADDEERIIFNDKDYPAERAPEDERDVTETPAAAGVTIDNRFIISSPLTCKSGQEVVNGKCRTVY